MPVIGPAVLLTVTTLVALGAQPLLYVIVTVPGVADAVAYPVVLLIDTIAVLLLLQVPPLTVLDKVVDWLGQSVDAPPMAAGIDTTVTARVAGVQPGVA